jgi:phage shock protein PspC (stress-responsive transcriptional regulator)
LLPAILAVDYNMNNTQVRIWLISFLVLTIATMAYFLFRKK